MQLSQLRRGGVCKRLCVGCYRAPMNIVDRLLIMMLAVTAIAAIADPLLL